ncbi:transglycosylase domain-containing protein [Hyphococcus luteus]|uniref:Penicillin-binding protein n=1 Tax=Hyphococcus luteus TaxID=2058213 RepID=A0A2S7JZV5_9PROT|nr:PBP1A family penicillin-binding protein [Marinicaulis flavus]PQA85795.1 penicillin-binding protein [Marinicaulis flavus]
MARNKKQYDRSGLSAVIASLWGDLKRGAAAFHGDFLKLFGFSEKPPAAKEPYAEASKYPKLPGDGKAWRNLWGSLALAVVSLGFLGVAFVLGLAFIAMAPRVPDGADLWNVNRQAAIIVLDRNGEEIAARGARYGEHVEPAELPDHLIKAILSTEDRRFYEHGGVDLRGMTRAMISNLKAGTVVEGGSTITQQLAKNLFLSPRQTYERKAREALLALWIEGHYTKDEILSLYLNRIYLGAGAYGVESAAQTYFGKSARDVTLAEAAMLAGLPKAPSTYAPTQNPQGAQRRAGQVLDNLLDIGAIEPFAAREARQNPPSIVTQNVDSGLGYFFDYAAAKAKKLAPNAVGDVIVHTTIDQKLQRDAEAAVKAAMTVEARLKGADQAALVAYDADGALRAMVGGRDYKESQFNRAVQAKRQPGSAFKPFVYVAAMEAGLTPQSRFIDQPIDIDGWKPTNYTPGYRGPVRIAEALAKSINTVAVQVTEQVGRGKVAEAAKRLGIKSDVPPHRSISLGAVDVTLEELVGAYIPFARHGLAPEPYAIEKIETRDGEMIFEHENGEPPRVMTDDVAEKMNHLLYQVMLSGTGRRAALGRRQAAGKTGTTNDWRDAWFVGYTPQIIAGVWVGNDDYTPMEHVTGGTIPATIWKDFMLSAHQGLRLASIDGAYPAVSYASEPLLLNFYAEVSRGLNRVRRDGNERRFRR